VTHGKTLESIKESPNKRNLSKDNLSKRDMKEAGSLITKIRLRHTWKKIV